MYFNDISDKDVIRNDKDKECKYNECYNEFK